MAEGKTTVGETSSIRIDMVSKKITHLMEEGKTEKAVEVNAGMKTLQPIWNDLLYLKGKTN